MRPPFSRSVRVPGEFRSAAAAPPFPANARTSFSETVSPGCTSVLKNCCDANTSRSGCPCRGCRFPEASNRYTSSTSGFCRASFARRPARAGRDQLCMARRSNTLPNRRTMLPRWATWARISRSSCSSWRRRSCRSATSRWSRRNQPNRPGMPMRNTADTTTLTQEKRGVAGSEAGSAPASGSKRVK
ncbi:MAG: hypothetical protein BWY66_02254 [bacterium ADurb.Bin374]|nr:MAG: hypothetical protein BWY66_02254 [bacterium ADurb.Bin374]